MLTVVVTLFVIAVAAALVRGAYNQFNVPFSTVAFVATTAKSAVGIKAATNVCVRVNEVSISFDGATSTNAPAVCEFMQSTFGANSPGTNSTSVTPPKRDTGRAETIQATAAKAWTTEPTTLTLQDSVDIGQYNGALVKMFPFASPFIIIGGQGCVHRITSPNNVNGSGGLMAEE
jgi:hypothetical protein